MTTVVVGAPPIHYPYGADREHRKPMPPQAHPAASPSRHKPLPPLSQPPTKTVKYARALCLFDFPEGVLRQRDPVAGVPVHPKASRDTGVPRRSNVSQDGQKRPETVAGVPGRSKASRDDRRPETASKVS